MPFLRLGVRVLNDIDGHRHQCKLEAGSWWAPTGSAIKLLATGCKEDPGVQRTRWLRGYRGEFWSTSSLFLLTNKCGNISVFLHYYFYLFSFSCAAECAGSLAPPSLIEPVPPAVEVQSPNHWTTKKVNISNQGLPWWSSG